MEPSTNLVKNVPYTYIYEVKYLIFILLTTVPLWVTGQVGIGTTDPNPQTILDIVSNTKGVRFPTMTTAERDANLADNDPDTDYPTVNTPALDPIPAGNDVLQDGTTIFNSDVGNYQFWSASEERWSTFFAPPGFADGNDGTVLMNFPEFNDAGAVKLSLIGDTSAVLTITDPNISYETFDSNGNSTGVSTTYTVTQSVFGPEVDLEFNEADFNLAAAPVTQWPENETNTAKEAIWNETDNQIYENDIPGQVHLWRIVIQYQVPGGNAQKSSFQCRMYNPNPASTFTTQSTTAVLDGRNNAVVNSTFLFVTVADSFSLPGGADGGEGYRIAFAANTDLTISIRSILRISLFKD